ncbi:MAG: hypothetical protein SGJ27_21125 [Candidatus Melainabacteria bacterium]|nr:hypothetical protein [Candidatus Melainabacteria bacterium]
MNARTLLSSVLALAVLAGGYLFYRDYQYRQIHGTVTQVSLVTWDQEVEKVKSAEPVLVYFYRENDKNPANEAQNEEVRDFAWSTAGRVKVVAVNVGHIENLPLAIAHGTFRQPAFVIMVGDDFVTGPSGVLTTKEDLTRLLQGALLKLAPR